MTSVSSEVQVMGSTNPTLPSNATPSNLAKTALLAGIHALHSQLRDNDSITTIANKILQLFFTLKSKEKSHKKFVDDTTYVPLSARVKIELKGSTKIRETEKFKKLNDKMREEILSFQTKMTAFMKTSLELEIKGINNELMEMTTQFADLIMKQQILTNKNVCRAHSDSKQLTIKVFNDERYNIVEIDEEVSIQLRFKASDNEICLALSQPYNNNTPPMTQPTSITVGEKQCIDYVCKALKNTILSAINAYENQIETLVQARLVKETLLLETVTKAADDTAMALDNDEVVLPPNEGSIKDLIAQAILDHEKAKKRSKKTTTATVKENRGARKPKVSNLKSASLKTKKSKQQSNTTRQTTPKNTSKSPVTANSNHPTKKRNSLKRKKGDIAVAAVSDSGSEKQKKKKVRIQKGN